MLPLFPFVAGAAAGVLGVMLAKDKRVKKKLIEGKKYLEDQYEDKKEKAKAVIECAKEKKLSTTNEPKKVKKDASKK